MSSSSQSIISRIFSTSIGKKKIMAVTGLSLCGFLVSHLLGNFFLLAGADAFNLYAYKLTSTPLIYIAEFILLGIFLLHLTMAFKLVLENKAARPHKYFMKKGHGGETIFSKTMPYTGFLILVFLVLHLIHFKYGTHYTTTVDGVEMRDLNRLVIEYFANPLYTAWYCIAMFVLAFHLAHGVQSTFQSLGIRHPAVTKCIKQFGATFAIVVPVGFSFLAIWCHLQN